MLAIISQRRDRMDRDLLQKYSASVVRKIQDNPEQDPVEVEYKMYSKFIKRAKKAAKKTSKSNRVPIVSALTDRDYASTALIGKYEFANIMRTMKNNIILANMGLGARK
jgi:hypothetical protein